MPLYEYECPDCDEGVTKLMGINHRDTGIACSCGSGMVRKVSEVGRIWAPTRKEQ